MDTKMDTWFWPSFVVSFALKVLLTPSYFSTDFEVHRNWLAITHNLPLNRWYVDTTSQWTLDYPPFFAYFEWALSQLAPFVDAKMLQLDNHNYASTATVYFQRCSVIVTDIMFVWAVMRCLRVLKIARKNPKHFAAEIIFFGNIGLLFIDHIHFQYNGMLFGLLLLSISFLLEGRPLMCAFTFAVLLNFKHIFLYIAPAFAVYLLKFYCLDASNNLLSCLSKLGAVGLAPFVVAFGPFWQQLPQVFSRLFPFKRGLTHAYWAPNIWAVYNTVDKAAAHVLGVSSGATTSSGLVQEFEHAVLPRVTPTVTFLLTFIFMVPVLIKLGFYTSKSESKIVFLRAVVLCACASFLFGWHVHEKAILMCLIPLSLLFFLHREDAKYTFFLGFVGYFSLFPLLFVMELFMIRYSLFAAYMCAMCGQFEHIYKSTLGYSIFEKIYLVGFIFVSFYEHILSPVLGLSVKLPFLPLLITSFYCGLGVIYFFVRYYWHTLDLSLKFGVSQHKTKTNAIISKKAKLKQKFK